MATPPPILKTCRYHPDHALVLVPQQFALLVPPPYPVAPDAPEIMGATGRHVSPSNIALWAWYCPVCSYVELHYR